MSLSSAVFLVMSLLSLAGALFLPLEANAASATLGVLGLAFWCLFIVALIRGRRFKFDPLLR